jgi:hypothetical protein
MKPKYNKTESEEEVELSTKFYNGQHNDYVNDYTQFVREELKK